MPTVVGQDASVKKRITHSECGAIIEYVSNDVRRLYSGMDISGCSEGREGFSCPQCGKEVTTRSW